MYRYTLELRFISWPFFRRLPKYCFQSTVDNPLRRQCGRFDFYCERVGVSNKLQTFFFEVYKGVFLFPLNRGAIRNSAVENLNFCLVRHNLKLKKFTFLYQRLLTII